jgi:hypothetical protein
MESTSCGKNCPFVKQGFCNDEKECPHYIESWWIEGKTEEHKLLKDCAPKRMLLQQQLLQTRVEGMQAALEQSRNQYEALSSNLQVLIAACKVIIDKQELNLEIQRQDEKLIPYSRPDSLD